MILLDILNQVVDIDTDIFLSINRMHSPFFDYFMSAYSGKWIWVPMYAAIWYVMLRNFHWKVTLFCMIGLALVITIADQTGATLIRPYVERLRPANLGKSDIQYGAHCKWLSGWALWLSFLPRSQYFRTGILYLVPFP